MGKKKDKLMEAYLSEPLKTGDRVKFPRKYVDRYRKPQGVEFSFGDFQHVNEDGTYCIICNDGYSQRGEYDIPAEDVVKYTDHIGVNPFPEIGWMRKLQHRNYSIDGILGQLDIDFDHYRKTQYTIEGHVVPTLNWDPYVITPDGEKHHYQRDFCWTVNDERDFINSIYHSIRCGTIIVRKHSWETVTKEYKRGNFDFSFYDIVDGKQRLNTLRRFVNDEFTDWEGNYWSDLSKHAQREFLNSQAIGYGTLEENATDEDTIQSFLTVNFAGKPMSRIHITHVRNIAHQLNQSKE